ncbi:MAG: ClpX C4-type zinc finger protein [Phycisphaerae bacterium]|nr:ClpX C4-type zinc finger protein [Phycisphaerae bacterium]
MRREGTDPNNVQMSDVLCDFCHQPWTEDLPLIEGHHGSCICGACLTAAYRHVSIESNDDRSPQRTGELATDSVCTMCLETREDPHYRSPTQPLAIVCRRCIKLAAGALEHDPDFGWKRPKE